MLTKERAIELGEHGGILYHRSLKNADGTALRVRVNGKCKTWKRHPDRWELPVKYGMRDCFRICSDTYYPDWHQSLWTMVEPLSDKKRLALTRRYGLDPNVPLPILRDAVEDDNQADVAAWLTDIINDNV